MPKVILIYRTIPQYRIEFYNLLKEGLKRKNIELELIYGDNAFKGRKDNVHCEWATYKKNYTLNLHKLFIIWQPCLKEVQSADLVIVEQANKLLFNYYLILQKLIRNKKFAFWGHGLNMQISRNSIFNRFKLTYINRANWWFAYTEGIQSFLVKHGVKKDRITVVQNAIDTKSMNELYHSIPETEVQDLKKKYGIGANEKVLIYCGALSKDKNIPFLIAATDELKAKGYQFKLIIIGGGPLLKLIEQATASRPWMIYCGPQFGRNKAMYFRISDLFLLPGAMGLAILDSFAFETPVITIKYEYHGPEFEYVINDYNAVVTENNVTDYANSVAGLLDDPARLNLLKNAAALMIVKYNIQTMVDNFVGGIEKALM